jgi:hypothetical protein
MSRTLEYGATLVLAATLASGSLLAARVAKVGDGAHAVPQWNDPDAAYRRHLAGQHLRYRPLNARQRDYWDWRHYRPG